MAKPRAPKGGGYEVGYKKPPKGTRFRKGRSGNPKGRPKGARNGAALLAKILNETIAVSIGGRPKRMPQLEAILRAHVLKALKGDEKSFARVMRLAQAAGLLAPVDDRPRGGVLVVPTDLSPQEWLERQRQREAREERGRAERTTAARRPDPDPGDAEG